QVTGDVDLAIGAAATGRNAACECDERRDCEDCESPSSNHMVPPCACWEAKRPHRRLPSLTPRPPPSQLSGRECADDECGHMGWPNYYSIQNYTGCGSEFKLGAV